jgi:hypothetical protein
MLQGRAGSGLTQRIGSRAAYRTTTVTRWITLLQ